MIDPDGMWGAYLVLAILAAVVVIGFTIVRHYDNDLDDQDDKAEADDEVNQ